MARKHGQTSYFIEGEGFVGEETIRHGTQPFARVLGADTQPIATLEAERAFRFSRMFPALPKFRPDIAALSTLGQAMDDTPNFKDHPALPSGFTYLGQFIDHDITFDKTDGLPDSALEPEEIVDGRSPSLDLDSLYGRGPALETKRIYEDDKIRLRLGRTTALGGPATEPEARVLPNDLPRGDNAAAPLEATIGDPRNDENLAVAQTHVAFIKFHNAVVARLAETGLTGADLFDSARRAVTQHYQWIVLHDFLPRVIDPAILNDVINNGRRFFHTTPGEELTMPIEFSVAAYRFGHSMIRDAYSWNRNFPAAGLPLLFTFSGVNGDMFSFGSLPSNWPIDWRRLYDFSGVPGVDPAPALNHTRSIDTGLALALKTLPSLQAEGNKAALAVRNLLRGRLLGLPCGQDVAAALDVPALTPEQVRHGAHAELLQHTGFDRETPLWFYILKEAEVLNNGTRLGPVGSTLLAETFVALAEGSHSSILGAGNAYWRPWLPSQQPGHFAMVDLLLLVDDLNPLGAEHPQPQPQPQPQPRVYIVQPGDMLRSIAAKLLGDERRWPIIFQANRDIIQNPDLIRPGMKLVIPSV